MGKDFFKTHAEVPSGPKGLTVGLSNHLHPYILYMSSECSSEPAQIRLSHRFSYMR